MKINKKKRLRDQNYRDIKHKSYIIPRDEK